MRVAFIGTGSITATHADAIRQTETLQLCGCFNRTAERGRAFAEKWGCRCYSSVTEMLEQASPDIVVNAMAPHLHFFGLEESVKHGCHLVVEKPFARTIRECKKIIDLAAEHHVRLAVCESGRFNMANRTFAANREKFGRILHLMETNYRYYFNEARFAGKWGVSPDVGGGGMLFNVGVHRIAKMRVLAGSDEESVMAVTGCRPPSIPVEGDGSFLIRYKNGAAGLLQMCGYFPTPDLSNTSIAVAENGYIRMSGTPEFSDASGTIQTLSPDPAFTGPDYVNFYRALEQSFSGKTDFPGTAEEAVRDVAVILAGLKSQKTGLEVRIDEILAEQ